MCPREERKERNLSIDLLRCCLMFLIVLHHSAYWGYWHGDNSQFGLLFLFTALVMWHVDSFVAISGWFGIKFSWAKFFKLWGVCAFYTGLSALWSLFFERSNFHWGQLIVQGGWFTGAYMMLMLVSPILNAGVESVVKSGASRKVLTILAAATLFQWLPARGMTGTFVSGGGGCGQSLLMMVFVYLFARFMRLLNVSFSKHMLLIFAIVYVGVVSCIWGISVMILSSEGYGPIRNFTTYLAPHVVAFALVLVLHFAHHVHVGARVASIVGFIAPSMFGIYVIHDATSFGKLLYQKPESWLAANFSLHPIVIVMGVAIGVFFIALVIDILRRGLVYVISHSFDKVFLVSNHKPKNFY